MKTRLRVVSCGRPSNFRVKSSADARTVLEAEARGLDRECFWRIDLDARDGLIGYELVSIGSLDASVVHPREVFKGALLNNAHHVIVAHNHPSGDPRPSAADRRLTAILTLAGTLLDVDLTDHVILTDGRHFSFRDGGLL